MRIHARDHDCTTHSSQKKHQASTRKSLFLYLGNDPSVGSPTETLLRLLLPLSAPVLTSFSRNRLPEGQRPPVQGSHWYTQSVVATGGVYKGQGLSHGGLSDPPLLGIPRLWRKLASSRPKHAFGRRPLRRRHTMEREGLSEGCPLLSEKEKHLLCPAL